MFDPKDSRHRRAFTAFPSLLDAIRGTSPSESDPDNPFDFDLDGEADAAELAQRSSDEFNALPARYELDFDGEQQFVLDWDDESGGVPAALAADLGHEPDSGNGVENPLQSLLIRTMREHLAHPSPGDPGGAGLIIVDPRMDEDGARTLLPWSPHGPTMQNVVLAVIADRTHEVRPLRGAFTVPVLAELIRAGRINTVCSLRTHPECSPDEPKHVFTLPCGNYVVFFRACPSCYFRFFEGYGGRGGSIDYECLDPIECGDLELDNVELPDIDFEP